ncbi:MAG: hypothetical protein HY271_20350 [Deltaproteobacteria bacterium]|nr:hypothetical protein [Deltaproteobacteria bacterium]
MRGATRDGALILLTLVVALPRLAAAYPNGTGEYVTDAGPFCAGCHSSRQESQLREMPKEHAAQQLVDGKHVATITKGSAPYDKLSEPDRATLIAQIRAVDTATTITLDAPKTVKAGAALTVTAKAHGGAGPVVGVMLLDADLRYQARTPAAAGWMISGAPAVTGPDGKPQTTWTDKRAAGLAKNLNYVMVYGMKGDAVAGTYGDATVAYALQAPSKPGDYTLAAALLYGTEKACPLATVKRIGFDLPLGGFAGASGRVLFTAPRTVTVMP